MTQVRDIEIEIRADIVRAEFALARAMNDLADALEARRRSEERRPIVRFRRWVRRWFG
jgi:hypothetical protein